MGLRDGGKPDQHEKKQALRGSQKATSIIGKILAVIVPLMLLAIIGLSVAPVAAVKSGWTYYRHSHIANNVANSPGGSIKILHGWYKGHNTAMAGYVMNSSINKAMLAVPATTVALLLLSALTAFFYLLLSGCTSLGAKAPIPKFAKVGKGSTGIVQLLLTLAAPGLGLSLMAFSIAAYIVLAVFAAKYARMNLGANYVSWPDWAFFLAFGAGLFWLLLAPLTAFAAATAGASAGLDNQDVDDHHQQGRDVHEHDQREMLPPQQPKQQSTVPMTNLNGNQNLPQQNTRPTNGVNGQHLENMHGFVVDHDQNRGGLAQQTYQNYV